jgi:hypothetical protein
VRFFNTAAVALVRHPASSFSIRLNKFHCTVAGVIGDLEILGTQLGSPGGGICHCCRPLNATEPTCDSNVWQPHVGAVAFDLAAPRMQTPLRTIADPIVASTCAPGSQILIAEISSTAPVF